GQAEVVIANIRVYSLQTPNRLLRERLWPEPDQFILTKNEYIQFFPNDEYKNETNMETWEKGELILEKTDSISPDYQLPTSSWKPVKQGWYVLEVTATDKYG